MKKYFWIVLGLSILLISISLSYFFIIYTPNKDKDENQAIKDCAEEYVSKMRNGDLQSALNEIGANVNADQLSQQYIKSCMSEKGYIIK